MALNLTTLPAARTVLLGLLFAAAPLHAQDVGGGVAPVGGVRLDVGAVYSHSDTRFADPGTSPLGAWYGDLIGQTTGLVAAELRTELSEFFAATAGDPVDVSALTILAGEPTARVMASTRHVPLRLAVGVLPRTELTIMLPLERDELLVQAVGISGGTVGWNPAPEANSALLAEFGEEWGALGGATLLPLAESPIGIELNRRVEEATGVALRLPEGALDAEQLQELLESRGPGARPAGGLRPWRTGDLEIGARVLALSSFGSAQYPAVDGGGVDYRLVASAAARLATGSELEAPDPFTQLPSVGHTGFRVGADADLFIGPRFWIAAGASLMSLSEREAETAVADAPFVIAWSPRNETRIGVSPRYRLTESISVGARYQMARSGSSTEEWIGDEAGFRLMTPSGIVQRAGLEVRYTTLTTATELPTQFFLFGGELAAEIALGYLQALSGPSGVPAARMITIQGSLLHRLWGGN